MKIRSLQSCFFVSVFLFSLWSLLLVSLVTPAQDGTCDCEDGTSESGDCKPKGKSWVDELGDNTKKFLQENIFGQKVVGDEDGDADTALFLGHIGSETPEKDVKDSDNPFVKLLDRIAHGSPPAENSNPLATMLLERAKVLNQEEQSIKGLDFMDLMGNALQAALEQLSNTFDNLLDEVDPSLAFSMLHYLASEDRRKNPSWKRRQHRFYDTVSKEVVLELHDALYISQLAYVDTIEQFRQGLAKFRRGSWELAHGTTESLPNMPAHFLLVHKKINPLQNPGMSSVLPWEDKDSEIQVALVVRGTKHIADIISDALLEAVEYRGGHAHGGIMSSGKALYDKYLPTLKELLQFSGRKKIRLYLVGHSLGAAAAAIAAMEFNDLDWINVEAVGFGCPSTLSHELSLSAKSYITTVITDADIVPRLSAASMVNMLLDLLEFDWTNEALEDVDFTIDRALEIYPFAKMLPPKKSILEWIKSNFDKDVKPKVRARGKRERIPNLLIPPGNCLHFYRDGVGFSGAFTPCKFFDEIDLARTLIDDHLVMPGYHRALVTVMRDWNQDFSVSFLSHLFFLSLLPLPLSNPLLCVNVKV